MLAQRVRADRAPPTPSRSRSSTTSTRAAATCRRVASPHQGRRAPRCGGQDVGPRLPRPHGRDRSARLRAPGQGQHEAGCEGTTRISRLLVARSGSGLPSGNTAPTVRGTTRERRIRRAQQRPRPPTARCSRPGAAGSRSPSGPLSETHRALPVAARLRRRCAVPSPTDAVQPPIVRFRRPVPRPDRGAVRTTSHATGASSGGSPAFRALAPHRKKYGGDVEKGVLRVHLLHRLELVAVPAVESLLDPQPLYVLAALLRIAQCGGCTAADGRSGCEPRLGRGRGELRCRASHRGREP